MIRPSNAGCLRRTLAAVSLLMPPASAAFAGTEVYIGVEGSHGQPQLVIGMPPFMMEAGQNAKAGTALNLHDVVDDDLLYSRWFKTVQPPSAMAASDPKAAAEEWKKAGAGFVLSAKVADLPPKLAVTVSVLDLASGELVLERYYRQDAVYWRSLAHQIADDVVKQLTGKPGMSHTLIAFVNDRTGSKELYLVDYDGANLRRLTSDGSIDLLPRWSPDRSRLLYTSFRRGNPDLYEMDLGRSSARVFLDRQGLDLAGGFSPDGSKLVLTMSREKNPNIFMMNLADRSLKQVTNHFGVDTSPTFSPDGGQIAFISDRSGNPQVHTMNLATGKTVRLSHLNLCDSPSWSPTGEWIVFAGRAHSLDRMDIFIVDVTGSHVRQLTHGEGTNEDPAWSPDGRFIVFTSTRNRRRQIYIMDADGSSPRAVGDIPGNSYTPAWSP